MTNLTDARDQVSQIDQTVQALHERLATMHQEILNLERIHDRLDDSLLVIDRADDLRRSLDGPMRDQAETIRSPLTGVESAYVEAARNGDVNHDHAHTMTALSLQAARSARFLEMWIDQAEDSLAKIASSSVFSEDVKHVTSESLDSAMSAIERARRASYRLCEDLPMLGRTLGADIESASRQATLPVDPRVPHDVSSAKRGQGLESVRHSQIARGQTTEIPR